MPEDPNKGQPFGWAPGTVRSLVVLLLVAALLLFTAMFAVAVVLRGTDEVVARVLEALVGTVTSLTTLAVGFYFGRRDAADKT